MWLKELVTAGDLPQGEVWERDIQKIEPHELERFRQAHFFGGIGGWAKALELAGWGDRPVWTASLPCQPWSAAGKKQGRKDDRNVWPSFFRLVRECRPECIFGEQVAQAIGLGWLDGISTDLEEEGYTVGAIVLGAHSIGAPHIRQRLYWVAHADTGRFRARGRTESEGSKPESRNGIVEQRGGVGGLAHQPGGGLGIDGSAPGQSRHADEAGEDGRLADSEQPRLEGLPGHGANGHEPGRHGARAIGSTAESGESGGVGFAYESRSQPRQSTTERARHRDSTQPASFWSNSISISCRDGKARRTQPGIFPLAARLPRGLVSGGDPGVEEANASQEARVMRLKGYGNSIVPQLAAEFVKAFMETL